MNNISMKKSILKILKILLFTYVILCGLLYLMQELIKETDTLITLNGQRHNGMSSNVKYFEELEKILAY